MTDLRQAAQQALEALESLFNWKVDPERGKRCGDAVVALRAALAQQAEPVAAERERCAEYLMQQAAECRENSPTRVTLESCAAVLRLGLHAQAEPVQEPVAEARYDGTLRWLEPHGVGLHRIQGPLYTAPPQRKPEQPAPCPDCRGIGYDASGQLCWCQQNPSF